MNEIELIEYFETELKKGGPVDFPELLDIDMELAVEIGERYAKRGLIKLPKREIEFFEWLKINDSSVWEDLWGSDDFEPYIVGFSFLPLLVDKLRGFPICDLEFNDNYYFTEECIIEEEGKMFRDSSQERFLNGAKLSIEQALIVELCAAPIDIWHFAYRYKVDVEQMKRAVQTMAEDKIFVHVTKREQLIGLIKI